MARESMGWMALLAGCAAVALLGGCAATAPATDADLVSLLRGQGRPAQYDVSSAIVLGYTPDNGMLPALCEVSVVDADGDGGLVYVISRKEEAVRHGRASSEVRLRPDAADRGFTLAPEAGSEGAYLRRPAAGFDDLVHSMRRSTKVTANDGEPYALEGFDAAWRAAQVLCGSGRPQDY